MRNTRAQRGDSIPVNGPVRQVLRAVAERMGTTEAGRRAHGILASGSRYMSRRVLISFERMIGG